MAASSGNDVWCSRAVERSQSILGRDLDPIGQVIVQSTEGDRFVWIESCDACGESVERVDPEPAGPTVAMTQADPSLCSEPSGARVMRLVRGRRTLRSR
jgi:hypothetical protein